MKQASPPGQGVKSFLFEIKVMPPLGKGLDPSNSILFKIENRTVVTYDVV